MEKFDVVVIGGGPGGYPAAIRSAQLGASVALIEKEHVGGTCLNWGCIPTKTLIASSTLYSEAKDAAKMGLNAANISYDYAAMSRRKDEVVSKLRGGVATLLKANGVKVFSGTGAFETRNRIAVSDKSGAVASIQASATIIATGSTSTMPGFLPKNRTVVDSRAFLSATSLPSSMIVLGGGVIGCEFACMAAQLGVQVTIVEMLEDILITLDPDVRAELRSHMEKKLGIKIVTGKPLDRIKADDSSVKGVVADRNFEAELLLVSIGRRPVTGDLKTDNAGLDTDKGGYIPTDDFCRTKAATIFAVGDVTGGPQLAHAATSQGVTAASNAVSGKAGRRETVVPACIFTAPEIGCVGLTEQQAKEQGVSVVTGKFSFANLGKAMAAGHTEGFVKWIVESGTNRLVGAQAIGAHATELISEAAVAIRAELTVAEIGTTIHCHPTMSESWMEAAHAVHGECIHAAPKKRQPKAL
jgi:dihydrolipoamide dehydrogenase